MDLITHGITVAMLSNLGVKKAYGRYGTAALLSGAIAPDLDYGVCLFGDPVAMCVKYHRSFTHSITGVLLLAPVISMTVTGFKQREKERLFFPLSIIALLGGLSHVLMDYWTPYGTLVFYPFTKNRYTSDTLFIVDLIFSVVALAGLILGHIRKIHAFRISAVATAMLCTYVSLCAVNHAIAEKKVEEFAREQRLESLKIKAIPQIFSPFRWSGILETRDSVYQSWFSNLDPSPPSFVTFEKIRPKTGEEVPAEAKEKQRFIEAAERLDIVKTFRWFSPVSSVEYKGSNSGTHVIEYIDHRYFVPGRRQPFLLRILLADSRKVIKAGYLEWQEQEGPMIPVYKK